MIDIMLIYAFHYAFFFSRYCFFAAARRRYFAMRFRRFSFRLFADLLSLRYAYAILRCHDAALIFFAEYRRDYARAMLIISATYCC